MSNKMMNILMWALFVVLVIGIPIIFDNIIFEFNIISNLSREQAIVFWGNYASAILRSIMSMFGVMLTIRYYKNKDKNEEKVNRIKDNKLIEYYFEFLELLNEVKDSLIMDEFNKVEAIKVWQKCKNVYKFKVVIGNELNEFKDFEIYMEYFFREIDFKNQKKGQADMAIKKCISVIEKFYEKAKISLLK